MILRDKENYNRNSFMAKVEKTLSNFKDITPQYKNEYESITQEPLSKK